MSHTDAPPIIMTLQLDEITTALFERHRETFFPPSQNRVPAHLTLFQKLPGNEFDRVLREAAGEAHRAPFAVAVEAIMPLGRGCAYKLASAELVALRERLSATFRPWLTPQDREAFRPHVTVQNKVTKAEAMRTLDLLARNFSPFTATAEGFQFWHYMGGPWTPAAVMPFER